MKKSTLLKTGIAGTVIVALCCFTPLLVLLFGAVGMGWLLGCGTNACAAGFSCLDCLRFFKKGSLLQYEA